VRVGDARKHSVAARYGSPLPLHASGVPAVRDCASRSPATRDSANWRSSLAKRRACDRLGAMTSELNDVVSVLGGPKALGRSVRSPEDLTSRVREGLPFSSLIAVTEQYGIPRAVLCAILHLSRRNLLRRKEQKRLSADESDRLYRLARVLAHANRVFRDLEESAAWIQASNPSLGKQQPLALLDTDIGTQQVDDVLGRIEHGIVG